MTSSDYSSWLNRSITIASPLDAEHAKRVALALNVSAPLAGEPLPWLWQWAFFVDSTTTSEIGTDGHPPTGNFLPPTGTRIRMWAGGRLDFVKPLIVGQPATKSSTITHILEKQGRQGKLIFVTVKHEYMQHGAVAISEEQDIVYREPSRPNLIGTEPTPEPQWREKIQPTNTLLFRYSAVTFNSHRIHYDYPYVTKKENYPNVVVHGPLIATLMLQSFQNAHPAKRICRFAFRGIRPLIAPAEFTIAGQITADDEATLWAEQENTLAHQATLHFDQ
ncbi:FAS1-like dehydratase domain-containing protein [Paralcaligenes ureilyticus]|uniref:Itaconyl-CoA hydratase/mesaconyl-C4 CoA hydratase n=1 Tax=Paralcaligenes ureilyticus TaxID=627131 RepID=A0A4R3M806_9BURK|nr:MaoC family dehydratase N-terminal domain-containing protein [Paralcaligenes ureilyticus]TCT09624.1 itaconyl-CoA hydratase/mesaconyl-C4 CoA hydratase [Paralcaligenes ureilyticus]